MEKEKAVLASRSKFWIEDMEGNVVFGLGRYRILEMIGRLGSMHAAAGQLQMSYRAVWMRIRTSEERIGKPLVVREGKGSRLTPFAHNLLKQFKRLQALVEAESDEVYNSLMSEYLT
jgi:molybdate transport system regulatory protein